MKRITLALAGVGLVLALIALSPGAASALTFDVGTYLGAKVPYDATTNFLNFDSANLKFNGQMSIGNLYISPTSSQAVSNGVLTFSGNLGSGVVQSDGSTTYSIVPGTSSITITGTVGSGSTPISLSGSFSSGYFNYSSQQIDLHNVYPLAPPGTYVTTTTASVVNAFYSATVGSAFASQFGTPASFTGGFSNLNQDGSYNSSGNWVQTVSGTVTVGTNAAPIPSGILLFAPALLGLVGLRRRLRR